MIVFSAAVTLPSGSSEDSFMQVRFLLSAPKKSEHNLCSDFFGYFARFEHYSVIVGLSMMCYTFGKENKTSLGDNQLRGRIGKLLYCLWRTASCFSKSSKE